MKNVNLPPLLQFGHNLEAWVAILRGASETLKFLCSVNEIGDIVNGL
jgi:hypothetical protein